MISASHSSSCSAGLALSDGIEPTTPGEFRFGDTRHIFSDISSLRALGWEPQVPFEKMEGLLLSGGADVSPEFLHQPVPDPSILDQDADPERDRWEFEATRLTLERRLPIFAICKGMQLFNVALGGTLRLRPRTCQDGIRKRHAQHPARP